MASIDATAPEIDALFGAQKKRALAGPLWKAHFGMCQEEEDQTEKLTWTSVLSTVRGVS